MRSKKWDKMKDQGKFVFLWLNAFEVEWISPEKLHFAFLCSLEWCHESKMMFVVLTGKIESFAIKRTLVVQSWRGYFLKSG